ncbi:MAG: hypothetical protein WC901_04685 [Candidatus Margulisiibacteriota bacterium]
MDRSKRGAAINEYQNGLKNISFRLMDQLRGEWEMKEDIKRNEVIACRYTMIQCNRVQPEYAKAVAKLEKEYDDLSAKQKRHCCPENLTKALENKKAELSEAKKKYQDNVDLYYKNKTLFEQLHEQRIGQRDIYYSDIKRAQDILLTDVHEFRDGFNLLEGDMAGEDLESIEALKQDIDKKIESLKVELREFKDVEDISDFDETSQEEKWEDLQMKADKAKQDFEEAQQRANDAQRKNDERTKWGTDERSEDKAADGHGEYGNETDE